MEREFKMYEGKQLMMNKGVNAYMKAYEAEENACLENITYEDLERLQRQGLITNGRLACRIGGIHNGRHMGKLDGRKRL